MGNDKQKETKKIEKREHMLRVRMTEREFKKVELLSKELNLTRSEYVRKRSLKAHIRDKQVEKALLVNLNRINANLNMIAKHANTYKKNAEAKNIIEMLKRIENLIYNEVLT